MGIIIRNSIKATAINYVGVILGAISILFIQTKVLTPDQIGEVRLLLDKAVLVLPLVLFGMDTVSSRFYFHFEKDARSYSRFWTMLISIPFVLSCTLFIITYPFNVHHFWLISIILVSYSYSLIIEAYLTTKAKIAYPTFLRAVLFRLVYLGAVILYYYQVISFRTVLLTFTFWHVLHLILLLLYLHKYLTFSFHPDFSFWKHEQFKEIMTFSSFLLVGASSAVLVARLDTVMLEGITSSQAFVGIYTIGLSIAAFIEMPKRPVAQIAIPILSKDLANNELEKVDILYKKSALNLLIISCTLFSLIWINIDFIFEHIPNGEIYKTGKYVVFFLGLAKVFDLGLGINQEVISASQYYRWNLLLMPFLTLVTILLNFYFISKYNSASGAAAATLISLSLFNLLRTFLVKWKLGLLPFTKEYFIAILLTPFPFIIDYFFLSAIENSWIKMLLDSSVVLLLFVFPIYFFNLSDDITNLVNKLKAIVLP